MPSLKLIRTRHYFRRFSISIVPISFLISRLLDGSVSRRARISTVALAAFLGLTCICISRYHGGVHIPEEQGIYTTTKTGFRGTVSEATYSFPHPLTNTIRDRHGKEGRWKGRAWISLHFIRVVSLARGGLSRMASMKRIVLSFCFLSYMLIHQSTY